MQNPIDHSPSIVPRPDAHREQERLATLDRVDLLDTPTEEGFDRITRLARRIFKAPMSTITLIDGHRQWFKSRQGIGFPETERSASICSIAIEQDPPLVIPDTLRDPRVSSNPFIVGSPFIRFYAGAQLRSPEGHPLGTLCVMDIEPRSFDAEQTAILADLAMMVMREVELRAVAMTDSLTGALSRRAFKEEGQRALELAKRHKHNTSCVLLDLDHFKRINDTYGHGVGDLVLRATIGICREHIRTADLIGRVGGEEFAILLPHTAQPAALAVAEKLRVALGGIEVQAGDEAVGASASFGVATTEAGVHDLDELLRRADKALYVAKDAGRNTCRAWHSEAGEAHQGARRRVLKGGQIAFNGGRSTVVCTVRELSEAGALLNVSSTSGIPEQFKLGIQADEFYRSCQVTARRENQIEVAFQ